MLGARLPDGKAVAIAHAQVALEGMKFSEDGSLLTYELAKGGSDWHTIKIMAIDAATGKGKDLQEELHHIKFSTTAWTHDNRVSERDSSLHVDWSFQTSKQATGAVLRLHRDSHLHAPPATSLLHHLAQMLTVHPLPFCQFAMSLGPSVGLHAVQMRHSTASYSILTAFPSPQQLIAGPGT